MCHIIIYVFAGRLPKVSNRRVRISRRPGPVMERAAPTSDGYTRVIERTDSLPLARVSVFGFFGSSAAPKSVAVSVLRFFGVRLVRFVRGTPTTCKPPHPRKTVDRFNSYTIIRTNIRM
jgi:hypothetical protein